MAPRIERHRQSSRTSAGGTAKQGEPEFATPVRLEVPVQWSGRYFHFHFGVEIGDDVLECLDCLLDGGNLH